MRSILYFLLLIAVFIHYGNSKEVEPGKAKSLYDVFRDIFLHNFDKEKITNDIVHILRAFGGKEIMEAYYSLPKEERNCIMDVKTQIFKEMLKGQFTSPSQVLTRYKESCPKSAEKIQQTYDNYIPYIQEQMQKLYKVISSAKEQLLPDSFIKEIKEEVKSFIDKLDFSEFMSKDKDEL